MSSFNPYVRPGHLEVFSGPMKSGKSLALLHRVEKIKYMKGEVFQVFKPALDTRDLSLRSRFGSLTHACTFIPEYSPEQLLSLVEAQASLVAIDEVHFFSESIVGVVKELISQEKNVVLAGLDTDFRGEPFGSMPTLLALADEVHKLTGICDYPACKSPATRTQRLVNGSPADYFSPIILVGDAAEGYQCRCFQHHEVPHAPTREWNVTPIIQKRLDS
ncbi:MAG: thymidine kinase [archaeon]